MFNRVEFPFRERPWDCGQDYLELSRDGRAKPRISNATETPNKKPLAKWATLPLSQSLTRSPRDNAKIPAAVDKLLLLRVILPPRSHCLVEGERGSPSRPALGFQIGQQLLDAVFFFERGQAIIDVVAGDFRLRLADGLGVRHLAFHAVEGRGF